MKATGITTLSSDRFDDALLISAQVQRHRTHISSNINAQEVESGSFSWGFDFNIEERSLENVSGRNNVKIVQNCPLCVVSNLLRVAAKRQHSAGRFPPSSWQRWTRAVGQSHNSVSDEMAEPSSLPLTLFSLPPSLFCFSLSPSYSWILHFNWKIQHWRTDADWKSFFFSLHLCEKMSLFLALEGMWLLQLCSLESR